MEFKSKMLIIALASAMPWMSAHAQSQADLQKEIAALRAQLQALQQKVEAINAKPEATTPSTAIVQQVNRLEQRLDLAEDVKEKSGFKDMVVKGVIQAVYTTDSLSGVQQFRSSDGNDVTAGSANHTVGAGGVGMIEFTKHHEGGDAIDWTLRLTPKSWAGDINEASVSIPVGEGDSNRVIGGLIGDWTGYEYLWANQNPLITHNALFDFVSATSYQGLGMSHQLYNAGGQTVALKWLVGNIDSGSLDSATNTAGDKMRSTGIAYRLDWTLNEYASLGWAGNVANGSRNWQIHEIDGGYIRGDWTFNGMLTYGMLKGGGVDWATTGAITTTTSTSSYFSPTANGLDSSWWGVSLLAAYKATPRLQLIGRVDYIDNHANGGGTYAGGNSGGYATGITSSGFGPDGNGVDGANLTRISIGTNYQLSENAWWKLEYRLDKSTGANFEDSKGVFQTQKNTLSTAVVYAF